MKIDLSGKIALVTGGATGIGKGIAIALSKANATVIITSRRKTDIQNTLKVLGNKNSFGFNIDLSKKKMLKFYTKKLKANFQRLIY